MTAEPRPPRFPPPRFPLRRPKLFATTPPAVFPPILGLLGAAVALRRAALAGLPQALPIAELVSGLVLGLWLFAVVALKAKALRRPGVLLEDLRPLPGRAGIAAATMSGMAAAALIAPARPLLALVLLWAAIVAHAAMAVALATVLARLPSEQRAVNPSLHLTLVGFIVAAGPLAQLGWTGSARVIFWGSFAAALAIWLVSAWQLARRIPPPPLRPLLAIHIAPAALLSTTAAALHMPVLETGFAALGMLTFIAIVAAGRWVTASGFSPMWGAFTYPFASLASALIAQGDAALWPGVALSLAAACVNGWIAWRIIKLWPNNRLAQMTNAAEA